VKSLHCLTGEAALKARQHGSQVCERIVAFHNTVQPDDDKDGCSEIDAHTAASIQNQIKDWKSVIADPSFPAILSMELSAILDSYQLRLRLALRSAEKQSLDQQMSAALTEQSATPFFVHALRCNYNLKQVKLMRLVKMVHEKPCLLLVIGEDSLKGKAVVPPQFVNSDFNASLWLSPVLKELGIKGTLVKSKKPENQFNIVQTKFNDLIQIEQALEEAKLIALRHVPPIPS